MADRVGQQLGNYHLLCLLGRGAFAEVYLGEHLYLERPAAIKILHVQMEPETQEQFRREARTIAHLQHPHIVQVHDFGLDNQIPYLVMEYTSGGTLRSQHPKGTQLPLEQIVTYVKQIAPALDYAHQQRVIHRDVKPENLLLNAKDEVVLTDFGLAVVQRSLDSLSLSNPAGTPLYMAPEQIQRHPCPASDQYALGILVYEWLAGEAPFRGTLFEVFSHHLSEPPPSLCERLPDLPVAVEELNSKYQVPRKLGQALVDADQILSLLDGLDEEAPKDRTACIEAINTYRQEHWSLPLVVCSRSVDYLAQTTRVLLRNAVAVQPLTRQQVDDYLAKGKESLRALRVALHQDATLRELAETPLMLSILTLTYHGMPVEELLRGGIAPTRQQIFERYTEHMLSRRGTAPSYSPQQTKGWLAWLAGQMQRQNQTVFYLERLQPDWLSDSRMLRAYHR